MNRLRWVIITKLTKKPPFIRVTSDTHEDTAPKEFWVVKDSIGCAMTTRTMHEFPIVTEKGRVYELFGIHGRL
jgi:hypothetical protein